MTRPMFAFPLSGWKVSRTGENGFTLIEILVVTLILSVMVSLAFFAMGLYLRTWNSRSLGDTQTLHDYRSRTLVRNAMESVWEYFVTDPANERIEVFYPFFKGKSRSVTGVTTSSVFHKGVPAIFQMRLYTGDDTTRSMIYEEAPLDNWYLRYVDESPVFSYSLVYMTQITEVRFRYYGLWEVLPLVENEMIPQMVYRWQETFDGLERMAVPQIIELTLKTAESTRIMTFQVLADNTAKATLYIRHD